jgi:uncharacterized protein (DUF1330 family)
VSAPHADLARTEPSDAQLAELASHRPDGPIVALNLNRYRERAAYPPGTPDADVSGREAYLRYGIVALQAILSTGGRILWATEGRNVAIGSGDEMFHEVVAVWYPSRAAFLTLHHYPGYREAFELHRRASLECAVLLMCDGDPEPKLSTPYG